MTQSILTKNQKQVFTKNIEWEGKPCIIKVSIRYDDECNNGHNTFSITGEIRRKGNYRNCEICGCIHEEIKKYFPKFKHLIKWHLTSSDEPLHYIANTIYWAKEPNLKNARLCAIWEEATLKQLQSEKALKARLPRLMKKFKKDIEALSFIY